MAALLLSLVLPLAASAAEPGRSHHVLTTGNGRGFALYDSRAGKLTAFLDHPYKFLAAPADLRLDGPQRRNLLEELSFSAGRGGALARLSGEPGSGRYVRESNVIQAALNGARGASEAYYFEPFGLEANALVALLHVSSGSTAGDAAAVLRLRLGATPSGDDTSADPLKVVRLPGEKLERLPGEPAAWALTGRAPGAVVYVALQPDSAARCAPAASEPPCAGDQADLELRAPLSDGWFGVIAAYCDDASSAAATAGAARAWLAGRAPGRLVDDALAEWEGWRKPPAARLSAAELSVWRQAEAVLRMAQIREENRPAPRRRANHGMILASLPPGNWAIGWVRDGTYAAAALARMGHFAEAKAALDFFLNAEPVGKSKLEAQDAEYRISATRYYGDGEEEVDYSGTPRPNMEFDGWGLFLWAARQYVEASGDRAWLDAPTRKGSVYEAMRDEIARALEKNLEPAPLPKILKPDSSIWEGNWIPRKHYAFSTLAAARGLCDFSALAKRGGHAEDAKRWAGLSREVRADFLKAFDSPRGLIGALERERRTNLDGAMVEAFSMDILRDPKKEQARRTLAHLEELKLPSGGYKRNGGTDAYEIDEWIFVDLRLASAFYRLGLRAQADALIARVTRRAGPNFNILPEEYNDIPKDGPLGAYAGSIPMVGYGSGVYALALLDRDGRYAPSACGGE